MTSSSGPGQPDNTNAPPRREPPGGRFRADGLGSAEDQAGLPDTHAAPGNPLYRALALYLPWSVLVCLLPAILALIRRLLPALSLSGPALALEIYTPALFVSAAVTLYLEFLDPRTSHSAAHIRGGILAIIAAYLLSSFLSPKLPFSLPGLARQFFPAAGNITASLAALYIWVFVIRLRDLFRAREIFEQHLRRYRGEELRRIMLEDSSVMTGVDTQSRSIARHYSIQLGIVFVLTLVCGFLRAPLSIFQRALTMLVIVTAAAVFSLFGLFRQEQYFAGEGIAVPSPERRKRAGAGMLFCAAAGLLAALCASNNNLLPVAIIAAFFAWLTRILSQPGQPLERPPEPAPQTFPMSFDAQTLAQTLGVEETEPWPFWSYLPYIALALIIAAFLWFMIKPLFGIKAGSDKIPFALKIFRLVRGGLAGLKRAIQNFLGSLGRSPAVRLNITGGELQNMTEDLLAAWSKARKRELRQSLSLFARLILWGERNRQTSWKPSLGPGEFCALLAARCSKPALDHEGGSLPPRPSPPAVWASPPPRGNSQAPSGAPDPAETPNSSRAPATPPNPPPGRSPGEESGAILRCGAIFEEALYGPAAPDKETQREFRRLVEEITGQS
ncbi:MAG: hypothetical protein LBP20_09575 [Treponema sp.]|jgi:hypothetical protein|nr:hypothetical protein [Treponema sp.]